MTDQHNEKECFGCSIEGALNDDNISKETKDILISLYNANSGQTVYDALINIPLSNLHQIGLMIFDIIACRAGVPTEEEEKNNVHHH